jgi:hypothetical protein
MALPVQGQRSGQDGREADRARELLSCLVGVAHVEVVPDDVGRVQEVWVWGTGEYSTQQTVRTVESALRAHLDVALERSRIRVMLGPAPGSRSTPQARSDDPSVKEVHRSQERLGGPPPPPVMPGEYPARTWEDDQFQPPSPEAHGEGSLFGGAPPQGAGVPLPWTSAPGETDSRASGRSPDMVPDEALLRAPDASGSARILYAGYEVVTHRTEQTLLRVRLEWQDREFIGQGQGTDEPTASAEALARATLRALEAILHDRLQDSRFSLELSGLQVQQAEPYQIVMVIVKMRLGQEVLPVSGSVVVRHGVGLAAILATLQATDRRVRALLAHAERLSHSA